MAYVLDTDHEVSQHILYIVPKSGEMCMKLCKGIVFLEMI